VEWSAINDQSLIIRNQIEYLVKTVTGITAQPVVSAIIPANTNTIAAGRLPAVGTGLPLTEASRMDLVLHLTDGVQNDTYQPLSSVYIDKDTTPDYTLMDDSPIYRGFLNTRCTILDTDTRATANGNQQFAVTWDSQAVRFNWQGADWNYNGNLFIYLDSIANAGTTNPLSSPRTQWPSARASSSAFLAALPSNVSRSSTTSGASGNELRSSTLRGHPVKAAMISNRFLAFRVPTTKIFMFGIPCCFRYLCLSKRGCRRRRKNPHEGCVSSSMKYR
jgi:hypothetical protein